MTRRLRIVRVFDSAQRPSGEREYRVETEEKLTEKEALALMAELGSPYEGSRPFPNWTDEKVKALDKENKLLNWQLEATSNAVRRIAREESDWRYKAETAMAGLRHVVNALGPQICECGPDDECGLRVEAQGALDSAKEALALIEGTPFESRWIECGGEEDGQ